MNNPFEIPLTDEQETEPVKGHTPAPWTSCRWDDETVSILNNGRTTRIAWVFETADDEANTRLITAAPALLDELQAVKDELAWLYHNSRIKANAPERKRIHKLITDAEYLIEKIKEG